MKELKIDLDQFIFSLSNNVDGIADYLDLKSGEVLSDIEEDFDEESDFENAFEEGKEYRYINPIESYQGFKIMEDFVEQLEDAEAIKQLSRDLERPKPFRNFKDTLYEFPEIQEAWYQFEFEQMTKLAEQWCDEHEIKPIWTGAALTRYPKTLWGGLDMCTITLPVLLNCSRIS